MENNILIATLAWGLSGNYEYGWDIRCLSSNMAKEFGIDSDKLLVAIQDGLKEMSDEFYDWCGNYYGHCVINGADCYWAITEFFDEWTNEIPGLWLPMIHAYHVYVEPDDSVVESEMNSDEE